MNWEKWDLPSTFSIIDVLELDSQNKVFIKDFCQILDIIAGDIYEGPSKKILTSLPYAIRITRKKDLLIPSEYLLKKFWDQRNKFAERIEIIYPEFMDNDILFRKSWAMRWLSDCLKKRFLD